MRSVSAETWTEEVIIKRAARPATESRLLKARNIWKLGTWCSRTRTGLIPKAISDLLSPKDPRKKSLQVGSSLLLGLIKAFTKRSKPEIYTDQNTPQKRRISRIKLKNRRIEHNPSPISSQDTKWAVDEEPPSKYPSMGVSTLNKIPSLDKKIGNEIYSKKDFTKNSNLQSSNQREAKSVNKKEESVSDSEGSYNINTDFCVKSEFIGQAPKERGGCKLNFL